MLKVSICDLGVVDVFLYNFPHQVTRAQEFDLEISKLYFENELLRQPLDCEADVLCSNIL